MKVTVSRITDGIVVCEDESEKIYSFPEKDLGIPVRSCDVLDIILEDGKPVRAVFLKEDTERAKEEARAVMQRLRDKFRRRG